MGKASELSYANAVLFSQSPMQFLSVLPGALHRSLPPSETSLTSLSSPSRTTSALDEISFARPVPIGSVVRLTATVTKSSAAARQVHSQVSAEVVSVATGETQTTNVRPPSLALVCAKHAVADPTFRRHPLGIGARRTSTSPGSSPTARSTARSCPRCVPSPCLLCRRRAC